MNGRWNTHTFLQSPTIGKSLIRLRGLGEINDPNDFGQLIVCVIPLMFIFWRAKKMLRNIVFVILPVCALLLGVYLTHSRGALLALIAMAVVAARRRIGTVPALLLAGALFASCHGLALHGRTGNLRQCGRRPHRTLG